MIDQIRYGSIKLLQLSITHRDANELLQIFMVDSIGRSKGGARDTCFAIGPTCFIFMQFLAKKLDPLVDSTMYSAVAET